MTKHLFLIIGLAGMLTLSAQNLLKNGNFTEKNAGGGISASFESDRRRYINGTQDRCRLGNEAQGDG